MLTVGISIHNGCKSDSIADWKSYLENDLAMEQKTHVARAIARHDQVRLAIFAWMNEQFNGIEMDSRLRGMTTIITATKYSQYVRSFCSRR